MLMVQNIHLEIEPVGFVMAILLYVVINWFYLLGKKHQDYFDWFLFQIIGITWIALLFYLYMFYRSGPIQSQMQICQLFSPLLGWTLSWSLLYPLFRFVFFLQKRLKNTIQSQHRLGFLPLSYTNSMKICLYYFSLHRHSSVTSSIKEKRSGDYLQEGRFLYWLINAVLLSLLLYTGNSSVFLYLDQGKPVISNYVVYGRSKGIDYIIYPSANDTAFLTKPVPEETAESLCQDLSFVSYFSDYGNASEFFVYISSLGIKKGYYGNEKSLLILRDGHRHSLVEKIRALINNSTIEPIIVPK